MATSRPEDVAAVAKSHTGVARNRTGGVFVV